jgi:excisionase family DNA binding protein
MTATPTSPDLLSVKLAAALLAVSERTVYRMIEDGQLECVKIRGAVRIPRAAVTAMVTTGTTAGAA